MRIGINIGPQHGYNYEDIVFLAKAAEKAGFDRFTVSDHFFSWEKGIELQSYEAWTIIALLVPQTERIRLGTLVTSHSYRNPALLAKIVANLDNASNGRIDLGIGAGWKEPEYEAYGYPFPSTKTRILQLREALQIINLLWTEEKPSFNGEYYKIKETMFLPKPVQKPRVPIWVGTQTLKAPMMEETIARYADGLDYEIITSADFTQKMERMELMCSKVGRDFNELQWSLSTRGGILAEDEDDLQEKKKNVVEMEWLQKTLSKDIKQKIVEKELAKGIAGTPETVVERLSEYKDKVDVLIFDLPVYGNLREIGLDVMKILKERIIPKL